jgi:hypothetical protein
MYRRDFVCKGLIVAMGSFFPPFHITGIRNNSHIATPPDRPSTAFRMLCSTLTKFAIQALSYSYIGGSVGKLAAEAAIVLYNSIVAEGEASQKDSKVDRLIGMYYRSGKKWLEEANEQTAISIKQKYIEHALEAFVNASVVDAPINAARAEAYVGTCHGLLGRPDRSNFEKAYSGFLEVEKGLVKAAEQKAIGPNCASIPFLFPQSRTQAIDQLINSSSWASIFGLNDQIQELYDQMAPLAILLATRQSKHAGLRSTESFSLHKFWDIYVSRYEKTCGWK